MAGSPSKTLILILQLMLIALGLSRGVGYVVDHPFAQSAAFIGFISAASPLPVVFGTVGDSIEYLFLDMKVTMVLKSGEEKILPITPDLFSRIPGSHSLRVAYAYPFILSDVNNPVIWKTSVHHAFCEPASLLPVVNIEQSVAEVRFQRATRFNQETLPTLVYKCSP